MPNLQISTTANPTPVDDAKLAEILANPGFGSRLLMMVTLTAGAIFVMWLGEQITERGIGNGMSLLITFSILERLWPGAVQLVGFIKDGVIQPLGAAVFLVILVGVIAAVTLVTLASRRIRFGPAGVPVGFGRPHARNEAHGHHRQRLRHRQRDADSRRGGLQRGDHGRRHRRSAEH